MPSTTTSPCDSSSVGRTAPIRTRAIGWGALAVSLSALLIAFCQPVPARPFYTIYFLGEYVFGYLFVAARYANRRGKADVLWIPGANREASA